jgi:hypothetical protein
MMRYAAILAFASLSCIGRPTPNAPALFVAQESSNPAKSVGAERQDVFASVMPALRKQTRVPLRLPSFLPDSGDKDSPIYAILESADPQGYEIQLAWSDDCNGGNACHYGTVQGRVTPPEGVSGRKVPVTLEGGIKGYFIDASCGAHCNDSWVGWSENGFHYSIGIKAEKKRVLIRVANSAIAAGHAQR